MTILSNETEKLISHNDSLNISAAADEMKSDGRFLPSRLTLCVYHSLMSVAIRGMSASAMFVLIFLLLYSYYGGACLLSALLISVLGESLGFH